MPRPPKPTACRLVGAGGFQFSAAWSAHGPAPRLLRRPLVRCVRLRAAAKVSRTAQHIRKSSHRTPAQCQRQHPAQRNADRLRRNGDDDDGCAASGMPCRRCPGFGGVTGASFSAPSRTKPKKDKCASSKRTRTQRTVSQESRNTVNGQFQSIAAVQRIRQLPPTATTNQFHACECCSLVLCTNPFSQMENPTHSGCLFVSFGCLAGAWLVGGSVSRLWWLAG